MEAYRQSAVAVAAREYGIKVHALTLEAEHGLDPLPKNMKFDDWCPPKMVSSNEGIMRTQAYVTTLLAGSVGRLLRMEKSFGYMSGRRRGSPGRENYLARTVSLVVKLP